MINPADLDLIGTEEGKEIFTEAMMAEFDNGKDPSEVNENVGNANGQVSNANAE